VRADTGGALMVDNIKAVFGLIIVVAGLVLLGNLGCASSGMSCDVGCDCGSGTVRTTE
jgi:hypothetical protein